MAKANKHFRITREAKRMQALMDFGRDSTKSRYHDFKNLMILAEAHPNKAPAKVAEAVEA